MHKKTWVFLTFALLIISFAQGTIAENSTRIAIIKETVALTLTDNKCQTMYTPDGKTTVIDKDQVEAYKKLGWYTAPVCYMYTLDGRVKVVYTTDIEENKNVGWYDDKYDAQQIIWSSTAFQTVPKAKVADWIKVGWKTCSFPVVRVLEKEKILGYTSLHNISVAEAICIVSSFYEYRTGKTIAYTDGDWHSKYIAYALENGILKDIAFDDYDRTITKAEFAHILSPLCVNETKKNIVNYIPDVHKTDPCSNDIYLLYEIGLTAGNSPYGTFGANEPITLGEVQSMVSRLVDIQTRVAYRPSTKADSSSLDISCVLQNPDLPTGCEVTALATTLNYLGYTADKNVLADLYLDKGAIGQTDPNTAFIGDPRSNSSYGCYAPVIVKCAEKYLKAQNSSLKVYNTTGADLESLLIEVELGNPVIIWATMYMHPSYESDVWYIDGKHVPWIANEHCMVLYGFDKTRNVVYISDPLRGNVEYNRTLFETRFKELSQQSVIIKPE